jgi:hypothetical protein
MAPRDMTPLQRTPYLVLKDPRRDVTQFVTGKGHRRAIAYRVDGRSGQKVTFVERGPSGGGVIGTARDGAGRIAFRPGVGAAERRRIVAVVEQDGYVREELPVAAYRAPGPVRPGGSAGWARNGTAGPWWCAGAARAARRATGSASGCRTGAG